MHPPAGRACPTSSPSRDLLCVYRTDGAATPPRSRGRRRWPLLLRIARCAEAHVAGDWWYGDCLPTQQGHAVAGPATRGGPAPPSPRSWHTILSRTTARAAGGAGRRLPDMLARLALQQAYPGAGCGGEESEESRE